MKHLIDKDALLAEINRVLNSYDPNEITSGRYALVDLRNFIGTLKVKEVDLKKEYDKEFFNDPIYGKLVNRNAGIGIAKHFFELGLKAQKGE